MKRFILAAIAAATLLTGVTAADAQRWHSDRHNRGYHHGYSGHRWGHRGYHRRSYYYYRHGHRYHGWR